MAYTRQQLEGASLRWVLTLTLRGQVYRYAEDALDVATDDGDVLHFAPGLTETVYEDRIAPPGQGVDAPALGVEVLFTADDASGWAALAAGDLDLGDAEGELALLLDGETWETREVVLSGTLEASSYGAADEPVTVTISESPWSPSPRRIPRDSEVVGPDTWPRSTSTSYVLPDDSVGVYYSEIVGAPGYRSPVDTSNTYQAIPLVLVETRGSDNATYDWVGLLGRGVLACVGVTDAVRVWNLSNSANGLFTPTVVLDELGQAVTIVTLDAATLNVAEGHELWCALTSAASGGRVSPYASGTLRQAGDVIAAYLAESGARVDALSLASARVWLAGYALDFFLNEQVDPVDVVLDDLLPLLPVALHVGPRGLDLIPWRYDATRADAVAHLDVDHEGGARDGAVERSSGLDVVNRQGIAYALEASRDERIGRLVYVPTPPAHDGELQRSLYAAASYTRYGEREGATIETDMVVEANTAARVLDWRIRWYGQTRESARFVLPQPWQALRVGDVVAVSMAEIGWSERVCIVTAVERAPGPTRIDVVTVPDWVRDGPVQ